MKIGVFDSGYGGLTILGDIRKALPEYDYIYLGDNARTPYGSRSFEVVYDYTRQCVEYLLKSGCKLVILACNTASAKALRTIQQKYLPYNFPDCRVLGVIRPTVECLGDITISRSVGIMATEGTIRSNSYTIEVAKLFPDIKITGMACPMLVPLIENNEYDPPGAQYFIAKYVNALFAKNRDIDTVVLGCTHYPLIYNQIKKAAPEGVNIIRQGSVVADSLVDYLARHPEISSALSKNGSIGYFTTEQPDKFTSSASLFLNENIFAEHIVL